MRRAPIIPTPYLPWAVGLGVTVVGVALVWVLGDRSLKRLRAEFHQRQQEQQARLERARQEREEALGRAAERAERGLALQQEAVELARQAARNQEAIIALLQRLVEGSDSGR